MACWAVLAALAAYVLVRNLDHPNDYTHFVPFGAAALEGWNPYAPEMVARFASGPLWSTWPPSFAPMAAGLAALDGLLGTPATVFLWQGANLLALATVLAVCARWLYDRPLALRPSPARLPLATAAALAGLVVPFRLVLSNFEHSQSNLLFLGLAAGGLWLLDRGRRWSGGLSVGLATAFKATPLLLLPWLAWRGRWRDLGAALAGCGVAWLVLPAALLGPDVTAEWYGAWGRFVGSLALPLSGMNQSLQTTVARLAAPVAGPSAHVQGAGPLGGPETWPVVLAAAAALAALALVAMGRPGRRVPRRREALEAGVVFAAMALFAPVSWKHHFVTVIPLGAALWSRTPAAGRWLGAASRDPAVRDPVSRDSAATGGTRAATENRAGAGARERAQATDAGRAGEGPRARVVGTLPQGTPAAAVLYAGIAAATLAVNGTSTGLLGNVAADWFERLGVVTWSTLLLIGLALWLLWWERAAGPGSPRRRSERRP